jgi:hypothetical protein
MIQRREVIFDDLMVFQQALLKAEALDYRAVTEGERQKLQDLVAAAEAVCANLAAQISSLKETHLLISATQAQAVEASQEGLAQILREHLQEIRLAHVSQVETLKLTMAEQLKLLAQVLLNENGKRIAACLGVRQPEVNPVPAVVPVMAPPAPLASEKRQTESDLPACPAETPVAGRPKNQSWLLPAAIGCLLGLAAAVAAMAALKGAL